MFTTIILTAVSFALVLAFGIVGKIFNLRLIERRITEVENEVAVLAGQINPFTPLGQEAKLSYVAHKRYLNSLYVKYAGMTQPLMFWEV